MFLKSLYPKTTDHDRNNEVLTLNAKTSVSIPIKTFSGKSKLLFIDNKEINLTRRGVMAIAMISWQTIGNL